MAIWLEAKFSFVPGICIGVCIGVLVGDLAAVVVEPQEVTRQ